MLLDLMKELWDLEMRVVVKGERQVAITFAIIIAMTWMRLMGL
jgi:hypothetical protein